METFPSDLSLSQLNSIITQCRLCPRLVNYRETLEKRASFRNEPYWRKPVPGFGDPDAWLLLTGLAPAAHGGNRTGRLFTGDESGRFLFNALFKVGFANQPTSEYIDDGLLMKGCYMTAAVKCAPPQNKPTPTECRTCSVYYKGELNLLKNLKAVLTLGQFAFDAYIAHVKSVGITTKGLKFKHGASYVFQGLPTVYCCYHPSQQNTFTGVLTETMMIELLNQIKEETKKTLNERS